MIKVYNRQTKEYETEKVAGGGLLDALYGNPLGKAGLELLVKRKFYSSLTGVACDTRLSAGKIASFIKNFNIDMTTAVSKTEDFKSFNEFFTRKLTKEARPFSEDKDTLLSPGDGRLKAWTDIDTDKILQIKGQTYSLAELVQDKELVEKYNGGVCILLRLAPVDYHRFHFIDDGICGKSRKIKGHYYSVNPVALNTVPKVFCQNKRELSVFSSENFGEILYIEVGATSVGSIVQTYEEGKPVKRGDEKGYFKFGGSTVILFLEKGRTIIDAEILEQTEIGYEIRVLAGEVIGRKLK
jgi:phosphatidylserine decarboxylase precursor